MPVVKPLPPILPARFSGLIVTHFLTNFATVPLSSAW